VATLAEIREEVRCANTLSDYDAVDVLWLALVKTANTQKGKNEHQRMVSLVNALPEAQLTAILNSSDVNRLLDLDPPLETVIVDEYEDVYPEKTAKLIRDVRDGRDKDPRTAMLSFGELLKRIRNKRAHGFKSRKGSRDVQILSATRAVLASLLDALL
jgi:hypothetical protein